LAHASTGAKAVSRAAGGTYGLNPAVLPVAALHLDGATGPGLRHKLHIRTRMREYQLFILTLEGCVKEHYALKCADDADARKRAGRFFTTYDVELWDGPRRVVRCPSKIVERARLRPGRLPIEM